VQTYPVLNKIKHAVTQKHLSYCHQISHDFIYHLTDFRIFQIVITDFSYQHDLLQTSLMSHMTSFCW